MMESKFCHANGVKLHYLDWGGYEKLLENFDAGVRGDARQYFDRLHEHYYQMSVRKFREEMMYGHVVELANTHHMCFVHRPDRVVAAMQAFLERDEGDG
jgi:hypothetical protein